MSLFDQQPMGPVPARTVKSVPDDPEMAAAGIDRSAPDIRFADPLPPELAASDSYPRTQRRWGRRLVGALLIVPFALAMVGGGLAALGSPEPDGGNPVAMALVVSLAAVTIMFVVARRVSRK